MGYKSDLTDAEWALIEQDFRPRSRRGSWCKHAIRTGINAILYVVKGGMEWRILPNDFPPWQTVYDHFSKWNKRGVWEKCLDRMVAYRREQVGRAAEPSSGIIAAQSVKTSTPVKSAVLVAAKRSKDTSVIVSWISWVTHGLSWRLRLISVALKAPARYWREPPIKGPHCKHFRPMPDTAARR